MGTRSHVTGVLVGTEEFGRMHRGEGRVETQPSAGRQKEPRRWPGGAASLQPPFSLPPLQPLAAARPPCTWNWEMIQVSDSLLWQPKFQKQVVGFCLIVCIFQTVRKVARTVQRMARALSQDPQCRSSYQVLQPARPSSHRTCLSVAGRELQMHVPAPLAVC